MSVLRPQVRRTPAVLPLSPHPKVGVSLEEWETKAPLDDLQLRSVEAVRIASQNIPLPAKVLQPNIYSHSFVLNDVQV
jgi:hypothetical protein